MSREYVVGYFDFQVLLMRTVDYEFINIFVYILKTDSAIIQHDESF